MSTINFPVTLKCKPVVWQYLINNYGEKLELKKNDWILMLMVSLLQRDSAHKDSEITLQYYTKEVKLSITLEQYDRFGDQLSKTAMRTLNNRIEDVIHQQLYQFLEFYVHVAKYQLNPAIEMFQQLYNFPPEVYTHAAIKKYYQRDIQPHLVPQKFVGLNVPIKKKKKYNSIKYPKI